LAHFTIFILWGRVLVTITFTVSGRALVPPKAPIAKAVAKAPPGETGLWTMSGADPCPACKVTFGPNAKAKDVTAYSMNILKQVMKNSNNTNVQISSTSRDAYNQARVMYDNAINGQGFNLYKAPGEAVLAVFTKNKSKPKAQVIDLMYKEVLKQGAIKVSKHCGDPKECNVFDVGPASVKSPAAFETAVNALIKAGKINKFLKPPNDPGFHLQILQPGSKVDCS